jgi:penicillin amidase
MPIVTAISATLSVEIFPARARNICLLPIEGWADANDWRGYISFDELPRLYNPPLDISPRQTTKSLTPRIPYYLSSFFEPPHRIRRIDQVLQSQDRFNTEDMAQLQLDQLSLHAVELLQTLSADLRAVATNSAAASDIVNKLLAWDGTCCCDECTGSGFPRLSSASAEQPVVRRIR